MSATEAREALRDAAEDVVLQEGRHQLGPTFATVPKAALDRLAAALAALPDDGREGLLTAFDRAVMSGALDEFDAGTVRRFRDSLIPADKP